MMGCGLHGKLHLFQPIEKLLATVLCVLFHKYQDLQYVGNTYLGILQQFHLFNR